jgi:hypothetical protein
VGTLIIYNKNGKILFTFPSQKNFLSDFSMGYSDFVIVVDRAVHGFSISSRIISVTYV